MGYFNKLRGARKVELDDKYWVLLRHLTTAESNEIGDMDIPEAEKAYVGIARIIVDHNLDDEDGRKVEITPELLGSMPQGDFVKLSNAFTDMESLNPEEQEFVERARGQARATFPVSAGERNRDELARAASASRVPAEASAVGEAGPPA